MLGGLIKAAGSVLAPLAPAAPIIGGAMSLLGGIQRNQSQERVASAQQAFQERMSDTSYQRQVEDLKRAGINPMLGYMKGSGASTPAGAMPVFTNPYGEAVDSYGRVEQAAASARQSYTQEKLVDSQVDKIKEEIKNIPLEGDRIKQAAYMLYQQAELMLAQKFNQGEITQQIKATVSKLNAETGLLNNQVAAEAALDNLGREVRQAQPIIDLIKPFIGRR